VESEGKNCASYKWSTRDYYEEIRPEPTVASSHGATDDHTNENCTHYSVSAEGNLFDLLLRSGFIRRTPPSNY
jgi:hypothetical protein